MEQRVYLKLKFIGFDRKPYWLWIYKNDGKFIMDIADDGNVSIARRLLDEEQVKKYIDILGSLGNDLILDKFRSTTETWKRKNHWYPDWYEKNQHRKESKDA